jgi:hypothetical protein
MIKMFLMCEETKQVMKSNTDLTMRKNLVQCTGVTSTRQITKYTSHDMN